MTYAEIEDDRIVVHTEIRDRDLIRQVPGMRWDPVAKRWHGSLSWGTCQVLRGVFGERLAIGPLLADWANEEYRERVWPCMHLRDLTDYDGDERLRPFQKPGALFMSYGKRVLLADDMGTGKTVQTIAAVNDLDARGGNPYPVLCIVPNSTKIGWADHWKRWGNANPAVHVITAGARKRKAFAAAAADIEAGEPTVVIINWEAMRLHSRLAPYGSIRLKRCVKHGGTVERESQCEVHDKELNLMPFRTVVADEAHKQKDPKSKQTRATWAVQHAAEYRFSLTGTPLANHPGDLWSIMHGVAPEEYPSRGRYLDRYCLMAWSAFGGMDIVGVRPDTRDEYFRILDPRMRRMSKDLVLPYLPDKTRIKRLTEMAPKQRRAYQDIESGMIAQMDDGGLVVATNTLTRNLRLLQFSSSYAEVNDDGEVRLSEPSSKLDALVEILEELGDRQVVVAAESRQLIELACARLDKHKVTWRAITGAQTEDQRAAAVRDFMSGAARVCLFTIKAGGVGLTLTAADTIVFLQRSWSMLENKQAEDRVHRIGAEHHDKITIIDLVTPGTVEEGQIEQLYLKAERLEEIVRDRERLQAAAAQGNEDARYRLAQLDAEEMAITGSDLLPPGEKADQ